MSVHVCQDQALPTPPLCPTVYQPCCEFSSLIIRHTPASLLSASFYVLQADLCLCSKHCRVHYYCHISQPTARPSHFLFLFCSPPTHVHTHTWVPSQPFGEIVEWQLNRLVPITLLWKLCWRAEMYSTVTSAVHVLSVFNVSQDLFGWSCCKSYTGDEDRIFFAKQ